MNRMIFKGAASTLIVSLTMVGSTTQSLAMRQGITAAQTATTESDRQASRLHSQAARELREGRLDPAQAAMEQAVGLSPRDAGYRLLLADIYLRQGRFESARATFADVLELDPSNSRAGLSFALTQIALGRPAAALAQLQDMAGRAPAADVGLAMALAGQPQQAIEILEPAARSHDATPRVRQNLALAYAIAGDWRRARAVAAQDLSPADIDARMTQWARFSQPGAAQTQVARLLGVSPVSDPGQPAALALNRAAPEAVQVAEVASSTPPVQVASATPPVQVAPSTPPVQVAPSTPPVQVASANVVSDWGLPPQAAVTVTTPPAASASVDIAAADNAAQATSYYAPPVAATPPAAEERPAPSETEIRQAVAVRSLTRPSPTLVRTAAATLPPAPVFRRAAPRVPEVRRGNSRYVVQIGAFISEANAERAWVNAQRRFGLASHAPLTAHIQMDGRTLHRVAIAGFAGQGDAQRLCGSIRAQGGVCFVRTQAGDASIRWAARYANPRTRNV